MPYATEVLPQLVQWRREGLRTVLSTLVSVSGSSPRPVGSQMAVNARGETVGMLTGGCADAAIVAEAQAAIAAGFNRSVRFGEGSPFVDVKLPCGSGIDVHFDVCLSDDELAALVASVARRRPIALAIDRRTQVASVLAGEADSSSRDDVFVRPYPPATRIVILGKGPICLQLVSLARIAEIETVVLSPDAELLESCRPLAGAVHRLSTPGAFDWSGFDAWTAAVSLFHDHDWEPPILLRSLEAGCFYVGALGSRQTHARRIEILRADGCAEGDVARIRGPVGLDIGAITPPEIAVSILGEIIAVLRKGGVRGALPSEGAASTSATVAV